MRLDESHPSRPDRNASSLRQLPFILPTVTKVHPARITGHNTQSLVKMADPSRTPAPKPTTPLYQQAIQLAFDVANGRHALSKLIPPALFLADALLCGLVIWKVPCTY